MESFFDTLRAGTTRIASPEATQRISSPGRMPYCVASAFGSVTWSLLVTFATSLF